MFIDTTYEGDLIAAADVGYTLMREANDQYGEQYNGIHFTEKYEPRTEQLQPPANGRVLGGQGVWDRDFLLDPHVVKGDLASGLLPLINAGDPGTTKSLLTCRYARNATHEAELGRQIESVASKNSVLRTIANRKADH